MNSLYNKLMAEKGAPRAANNPNTSQLRSAPMNLRSAMNKYAQGGGVGSPPPSAGDINNFVQANIGNPQAILQAAQQYGVSMDDLANATGYSSAQIDDYFGNAGLGSMGTQPAPNAVNSGTFYVPPPEDIPETVMPNEGLNEPEYPVDSGMYSQPDPVSLGNMNALEESLPSSSYGGSGITAEMLQKIMGQSDGPFGTQIGRNNELMQLLQTLKAK